jgi:hypothetical protein
MAFAILCTIPPGDAGFLKVAGAAGGPPFLEGEREKHVLFALAERKILCIV